MAAAVLFALSIVGAGAGMIPMLRSYIAAEEGQVSVDGRPQDVETSAGGRVMLWVGDWVETTPMCRATDTATGAALVVEPVSRYHHEGRSGYYRSVGRFEAQGDLTTVVCTGGRRSVYVTEAYDEQWALRRLLPVFVPFVGFAGAGAVCLLMSLRSRRAR